MTTRQMVGEDRSKAFGFLRIAPRPAKPRERGMTECRDNGMGLPSVEELCEKAGEYIDCLKTAGGTQRLFPREVVKKKIETAKKYDIEYSTGGLLERVLLQGSEAVYDFMEEARDLGYSIVEVSDGVLVLPLEHKLDLIKLVQEYGMKAKPEVAMAYGILEGEQPVMSAEKLIRETDLCLKAGAWKVTIEESGLTEDVPEWQTDIMYKIATSFDLKDLVIEASEAASYTWWIKNFGPDLNLFIDPTQIMQVEVARSGIWGKAVVWGRTASFVRRS